MKGHAEAVARGLALQQAGRLEEARACYKKVIQRDPRHADALHLLGVICIDTGQPEVGAALIRRAIAEDPAMAVAYGNLGKALADLNRLDDALANFDKALALEPHYAVAHSNRGDALIRLNRYEEGLAAFDAAIALAPAFAVAHFNRGVALNALGRVSQAVASYDAAIALAPDYTDALINRALALLLSGDYQAGWKAYETRKRRWPSDARRDQAGRPWTGEAALPGQTLLLQAEQGLGDTIQFARYIRAAEARGLKIVLEVQSALRPLARKFAPNALILANDETPERFDFHAALGSLPLVFGTTLDSIPAPELCLPVDPHKRARLDARLGPREKPRIGLAWSGNPEHHNDRNRSIAFERLVPLLLPDFQWVALQNDIRPTDSAAFTASGQVGFHGPDLADFADTAALLDLMDLVISVDTSIAHLAGAMGKPVWILLPRVPDWRWLLDRSYSPWYPDARLFRQDAAGDWEGVIEKVRGALVTAELASSESVRRSESPLHEVTRP